MNSRQLVGLKFIDGSGDEPTSQPTYQPASPAQPGPAWPGPAWPGLCDSHCPECWEHMLLSCAACLTAKGWFNYINCLMTEERAVGPRMPLCDKEGSGGGKGGSRGVSGPHYASLTVTQKSQEAPHNAEHVFPLSFSREGN